MKTKILIALGSALVSFIVFKLFLFSGNTNNEARLKEFNNKYFVFALNIPENLNFAGELMPVQNFDVLERFDRELMVNTYWQSQTLLLIKRSHRWFPIIEPILKKNNIPDDFKYLALAESGLTNVISPAGATGFWQFLDATARRYGLEINEEVDERYHVAKSTEAACKYLKEAYNLLGSWSLAAASYNMGIEGIRKQINHQKVNSYYDLFLNDETSRYVFRIVAIKEIISDPAKYGFHLLKNDLYSEVPSYEVTIDSSINDLVAFAFSNGVNYKELKIMNPWLRKPHLLNKSGKTYKIKIVKPETTNRELNK